MRWFWIDRFESFVCHQAAVATKNVSLGEPHLQGHLPWQPIMPTSLIVEGIAQTGGLLVAAASEFQNKVVLAKLGKAKFHRLPIPGDQLRYSVELTRIDEEGAIVNGVCHCGEELYTETQIVFAILGADFANVELFPAATLAGMLTTLRVFEIGVNEDGSRLEMPSHMRAALELHGPAQPDAIESTESTR